MTLIIFNIRVPNAHLDGMMFSYKWNLTDLEKVQKNGKKVFSCFHCAGGSTMGYKLAGYDVIGGVDIDKEMMALYRENHHPKHSFLMGIQEFNKIPLEKLPKELFELDILDGSPPCSSFSMSGSREDKWGVKKKFREGQSEQVLDDLFFHFIETARRLQPKIVVAENVKGLLMGKAKGYVKQINEMFNMAGYKTQLFLLNAAFLGVPQRRERVFFIAQRKDLPFKDFKISTFDKVISFEEATSDLLEDKTQDLPQSTMERWLRTKPGQYDKTESGNTFGFFAKESLTKPCSTITATQRNYHPKYARLLNVDEMKRLGSFPFDYKAPEKLLKYAIGMSVPPVMIANISKQIGEQLLGTT